MSLMRTAQGLEPRVLGLALAATVAIAAIACVLYGIKAPLKVYQELTQKNRLLTPMLVDVGAIDNERITLQAQLNALRDPQNTAVARAASSTSQLIQTLDQLATQHHIKLSSVSPTPPQDLGQVQEISYEIAASGSYEAFHAWMAAISTTLNSTVIRQFIMESGTHPQEVTTRLILSLYTLGGGRG